MSPDSPKVFISYSHDSEQHKELILALADRLRREGVDCMIDQYINGFPPENWQRWMETQIENSDFVLVVCTPRYLKRYRGLDDDGGRGATFEGVVISQTLYDTYCRNTKFVPVLPDDGDFDNVPLPLKGFSAFKVKADYEGLYRYLTGQPLVIKPDIGEMIRLEASATSANEPLANKPPQGALNVLQERLDHYFQEQQKSLNAAENNQALIADLQQQITDWMKRYYKLAANIEEGLLKEPDSILFKYAKEALEKGKFEDAAKLHKKSAQEWEKNAEKIDERIKILKEKREQDIDLAARDRFNAGTAYELNFQPILALQEFEKAYKHRPDNVDYAFKYAVLAQKQNQRRLAEDVYSKLIDSVRKTKPLNEEQLGKLATIMNNLAALIAGEGRRGEAEALYKEALTIRRELAKDSPQVYLPYVATTLNNLATLIADEAQRHGEAEKLYNKALTIRRKLAKDNPQVYLPYVATTLNNLATLIADEAQRRGEAEKLYNEALTIGRKLAKDNPQVYLPDIAGTLNNLAILAQGEAQRRGEAEKLYNEALTIGRELAKHNPQVYLPAVAMTLNNLANLVQSEAQRRGEAEKLYNEALTIRRKLAESNPQVYLPDVATTLNNLATLVKGETQRRVEAEKLYKEALTIRRKLAEGNPQVYLPDLANTLGAFGLAYFQWKLPSKAKPLLREATQILSPFAKQLPTVFGDKQAYFSLLAVQAAPEDATFICNAMTEAAEVAQNPDLKATAKKLSNL